MTEVNFNIGSMADTIANRLSPANYTRDENDSLFGDIPTASYTYNSPTTSASPESSVFGNIIDRLNPANYMRDENDSLFGDIPTASYTPLDADAKRFKDWWFAGSFNKTEPPARKETIMD